MAKKVVKKTKIKLLNILLILGFIAGISYGIYYSFQIPIKNILIKNMGKIDKSVLAKISDIEYKPNEYDKDRFLLYMDDGNMVYLTLTKFNMINYYNDVLEQLEDRKGILYLDNGNHFQIKE